MIEIEKKFILSDDDIRRLTEGAVFISEKYIKDTYFDTQQYALTTRDTWLRQRDECWELKVPLRTDLGYHDQYQELQLDAEITAALGLPVGASLAQTVLAAGYQPFAELRTLRREYRHGDFTIDLDVVDYGYQLGEIELLVEQESQMAQAVARIAEFAQRLGLSQVPVRGKLIEYLRRFKPKHYQCLVAAGVLKAR